MLNFVLRHELYYSEGRMDTNPQISSLLPWLMITQINQKTDAKKFVKKALQNLFTMH